jgi:nucleoside-diphosphate-sugar epimerase
MTVLVTGAAGFLGRNLVTSLLADGQQVTGVDNFITSDRRDLALLLREPGFTFHELDVTSPEFRALAGNLDLESIYHLACPTGVPNNGPLGLEMLTASYEGSRAVLEAARARLTPVVFASSAEVYGDPLVSPQGEAYTGNVDTLGARKGYEEGQRGGATLLGLYAERDGVPAKIVRVFNTYGPGMCLDETRVIPFFVRRALTGRPLTVHGDGSQTRCHTYVDDMVRAFRSVLSHGQPGRPYNAGSETPVTVLALAELVLELTGATSGIEHVPALSHDHQHRLPDTTRIRTELGWQPETDLIDGLARTISDIRERIGRALQTNESVA